MKREVDKNKAARLINLGNLTLITSSYKGKDTITTCAWHSPCSHAPACILVALAKKHLCSELIRGSGEFIVNAPGWDLKDAAVYCGTHSGKDCDKFKETKLTREDPHVLRKMPKIKECLGSIECSLADVKTIGDHFVFFAQPLFADAQEELFDFDNLVWRAKAQLIFHVGGKFFMEQGRIS